MLNRYLTTLSVWLACHTLCFCQFGPPQKIHANAFDVNFRTFQVCDLNNDGNDDVVLDVEQGIMYSLGNGDGTFSNVQYIDSLFGAYSRLYAGDVTGDGMIDLLYDVQTVDSTYIVLRQGLGSLNFGPEDRILGYWGHCQRFEVGDLDNDGDLDLALANEAPAFGLPYVQFYLGWAQNLGGSVWTGPGVIQTDLGHINDLSLVDIDNDGDKDIVLSGDGMLDVFRVDGGGAFTFLGNPVSTTQIVHQCVGLDADGDGDQDVAALIDGTVELFLNNGSGVLSSTTPSPDIAGSVGYFLTVGDMDNDGVPDLVSDTKWFKGDGTGSFADTNPIWPVSPIGIQGNVAPEIGSKDAMALIDANGDSAEDLLVASNGTLDLYVNSDDGPVGPPIDALPQIWKAGGSLFGADLNLDGLPDAVVTDPLRGIFWFPALGNGGFGDPRTICRSQGQLVDQFFFDADNDGDQDVAYYDAGTGHIMLAKNDGSGNFQEPISISGFADNGPEYTLDYLIAADMDGDGDIDIVSKKAGDNSWYWYPNDGTGAFGDSILLLTAPVAANNTIDLVDIDGNGAADLVSYATVDLTNEPGNLWGLPIYMNDGAGNLTLQDTLPGGELNYMNSPTFYDVDQDGDEDFVVNGGIFSDGPLISWISNEGNGHWSSPATLLSSPNSVSELSALHFVDIDGDGDPDLLFTNTPVSENDSLKVQLMVGLGGGNFDSPQTVLIQASPYYDQTYLGVAYTTAALDPGPPLDVMVTVSPSTYGCVWMANLSSTQFQVRGHIFHDTNQNGVRDPGEQPMSLVQVNYGSANAGVFSYPNGEYVAPASEGAFTVGPLTNLDTSIWQLTTPASYSVDLTADAPVSASNDFGLTAIVDTSIISMELVPPVGPCGGDASFWFNYANEGTRIENGMIVLHFDSILVPENWSFDPLPALITDTTFYWEITDLGYMEHRSIHAMVFMPSAEYSGDTLSIVADILREDTAGNILDTTSSSVAWVQECSYDPNDKKVSPEGFGAAGAVPMNTDQLTYTIRFQNTGTGTAYQVILTDQIPDGLDLGSIDIVGFSHQPTQLAIDTNRVLTVRFMNIMLPPSQDDITNSQGFITFRIRVDEGLPSLTQFSNSAEIYFDYNPPISTDTTITTLVDCELWQPAVDQTSYDTLQASEGISYQWYLNDEVIPDADEQWLTITAQGEYSVTVTSEYGCTSTSEQFPVIETAIPEHDRDQIVAVPNPFRTGTTLLSPVPIATDSKLLITDMEGRLIRSVSGNGSPHLDIPRGELAGGVYMARLVTASGSVLSTLRLVVE